MLTTFFADEGAVYDVVETEWEYVVTSVGGTGVQYRSEDTYLMFTGNCRWQRVGLPEKVDYRNAHRAVLFLDNGEEMVKIKGAATRY